MYVQIFNFLLKFLICLLGSKQHFSLAKPFLTGILCSFPLAKKTNEK
jgi:hypothetical protein